MRFLHVAALAATLNSVFGAKILIYMVLSSYSHRIAVWPYVEQLAATGHNVTFVQPYPPKNPNQNVTEFYPKSLLNSAESNEDGLNILKIRLEGGKEAVNALNRQLLDTGVELCSKFLKSKETQEWISRSEFDLVVIDDLMNECAYGLAHKFGAKTILYLTSHPSTWRFEPFGVLLETSWLPDLRLSPQYPMGFWARVKNTLAPLFLYFERQYLYYPKLDKVFQETLGMPDIPSVSDLEKETSLVFTNTHYSEEVARSLPPLFVPVGGMHCGNSSEKLPQELETFINSSPNGFVYVSFGSEAKISKAPEDFQNIFYAAMANTNVNFIWKYEGERHEGIPKNVYTAKWLPQQAILAHPKIKTFLTHGGLLSVQEATWHGVPLLVMPIFSEQDYNAMRVQRTKRGIMLDPNTLTTEILGSALTEITENPIYKNNMVKLSIKFRDRLMKPVDTAVWWTEYILNHEDHSDLKPLGMDQTWFVRRCLDVWAFVAAVALLTALVISYAVLKLTSYCLTIISRKKLKTG